MRLDRILDADGNRAAEGLRVLEEIARFLGDDADLTRELKVLRHDLRAAVPATTIAGRDTPGDVGTAVRADDEMQRRHLGDLITANANRVAEALRSLEEFAKLAGLPAASFQAIRYRLYEIQRRLMARLPGQRLWQVKLYALIDTALCPDPLAVAEAVAEGGAGAVQFRAKGWALRAYRDLAGQMQMAVRRHGALFIVNDHVAVAAALGSDGVHLGQDDLSVTDTRKVVGPLMAIGVSVHEPGHLEAAQDAGADYVGLGPMFATATKPHEPERGPALLDAVRDRLRVPSYAIGGLDRERLADLLPRLPHGVAVAGALCRTADPRAEARAFQEMLSSSRR